MIRFASLSALLLATIAVAHAQPANQRAEAEARGFLLPCHQPDQKRQDDCRTHQQYFVELFIAARSGEISSMELLAGQFNHTGSIGLPRDQVQACAWQLAAADLAPTAQQYGARMDARNVCGALSPLRYAHAEDRADRIVQQIQTEPTQLPKWTPPPGLTSTASPLQPN